MRPARLCIPTLLVALVAGALAAASAATPPDLRAKRAEATHVLAETAALDQRLNAVTEQYDSARVHLHAVQGRLGKEQVAFTRARAQYKHAQQRVANLLVQLYVHGRPSAIEAILGAKSVDEILTIADAEGAISRQAAEVAAAAAAARARLERAVARLRVDRRRAARAVAQMDRTRAGIERGLARRRALLASIQTEISRIQARERARQERLAAIARARLRAEARARARAEALAAARARAARARAAATARAQAAAAARAHAAAVAAEAAVAPPTSTQTTTATPLSPAPPAPTTTDTIPAAPTTTAPESTTPTAPPAGPGHPEVAQVALGYIGVPYQWGGATPAGFDCSGLVSFAFAQIGIDLPHSAAAQWLYGAPVAVTDLQPGDLVFFDSLNHVGIYIGAGQFVHAPHTGTFVRIDNLSEPWYSSHYVGARRI
jgi:peptidoglycan DL-endopeptidase CwlO